MDRPPTPTGPAPRLDQITTVFQNMDDPAKFVLTYASAIRKYFFARTQRNLAYTALRLVVDFPREDSKSLALRAGAFAGEPVSPETFRQQLSRARRVFARLLLIQAAETLQDPSPEQVDEELLDLGLMQYVRDFLPGDWCTSGTLPSLD